MPHTHELVPRLLPPSRPSWIDEKEILDTSWLLLGNILQFGVLWFSGKSPLSCYYYFFAPLLLSTKTFEPPAQAANIASPMIVPFTCRSCPLHFLLFFLLSLPFPSALPFISLACLLIVPFISPSFPINLPFVSHPFPFHFPCISLDFLSLLFISRVFPFIPSIPLLHFPLIALRFLSFPFHFISFPFVSPSFRERGLVDMIVLFCLPYNLIPCF